MTNNCNNIIVYTYICYSLGAIPIISLHTKYSYSSQAYHQFHKSVRNMKPAQGLFLKFLILPYILISISHKFLKQLPEKSFK